MLLDQFAPHPDFVETHSIDVGVSADEAYRAIWTTDFASSRLIRGLWFMRTLPNRLFRRQVLMEADGALTLQTLIDKGFGKLAEAPDREVVLGLAGRFWRPISNPLPFRRENFTGELPAGCAMALWSFAVEKGVAGKPTRIVTETRVACADRASKLKFGLYWSLVRPFSGLIRIVMLRAIERTCRQLRESANRRTKLPQAAGV